MSARGIATVWCSTKHNVEDDVKIMYGSGSRRVVGAVAWRGGSACLSGLLSTDSAGTMKRSFWMTYLMAQDARFDHRMGNLSDTGRM